MNLREKLKKITVEGGNRGNKDNQTSHNTLRISLEGAIEISNEAGGFLKKEKTYPLDYKHGIYKLSDINKLGPGGLSKLDSGGVSGVENITPGDLLFVDTETTGLMGGSGTLVFLVGIGYFDKSNFKIEQFLIRDFEDEPAMLFHLGNILKDYPAIVSFNGKSFDLPLLNSRFILNRFNPLEFENHIDLLYPARRVWNHLESCALGSLEERVLNINRIDDLPGHEVPKTFFRFLNEKKGQLLQPVLKHNLLDILTLVTLMVHLVNAFSGVIELTGEELYNLGKAHERDKNLMESIKCYEMALKRTKNSCLRSKICHRLSWQYKRAGRWKEAVTVWEEMISNNLGGIFPYVELAKYYEHREKNLTRAFKYTEQALAYLNKYRALTLNNEKREELIYRQNRIRHKLMRA
ncbi:ribonuclease H-like domain-containing protein [Halothermothrix orenii]|uniref:Tetratricopeptide TPR_2 repeat protein n=1 Tax=Halothermothrix orenii (strain H 168 / OCM 544 / DSM 9562) TaxID=373903 RepID=B8CY42_HALOH|nr:ribonuclease H-like domain-containing protein [Halothermothrix orenii]ACL70211.1 Tetratricopeptide TPR_2 repeat protein [Halothermothrix orenii H 168]